MKVLEIYAEYCIFTKYVFAHIFKTTMKFAKLCLAPFSLHLSTKTCMKNMKKKFTINTQPGF